jgi:hypothetical protein
MPAGECIEPTRFLHLRRAGVPDDHTKHSQARHSPNFVMHTSFPSVIRHASWGEASRASSIASRNPSRPGDSVVNILFSPSFSAALADVLPAAVDYRLQRWPIDVLGSRFPRVFRGQTALLKIGFGHP